MRRVWVLGFMLATAALALRVTAPVSLPVRPGTAGVGFDISQPALATLSSDRFVLVYSDHRRGQAMDDVSGAVLRVSAGAVVPSRVDLPLVTGPHGQTTPDIACSPGRCLLVWSEGGKRILAQRFDDQLTAIDPPFVLRTCSVDCFSPKVAREASAWLVAYSDAPMNGSSRVFVRRIADDGTLPGVENDLGPSDIFPSMSVAFDGTNSWVSWPFFTAGELWRAVLPADAGVPLPLPNPLFSLGASAVSAVNDVAAGPQGVYLSWTQRDPTNLISLWGAVLSLDGGFSSPPQRFESSVSEAVLGTTLSGTRATIYMWSIADAALEKLEVSLVTGQLTGFGSLQAQDTYKSEVAAAELPSGARLTAATAPFYAARLEIVPVDELPLHLVDAGAHSPIAHFTAGAAASGEGFVVVGLEQTEADTQGRAYVLSPLGDLLAQNPLVTSSTFFDPQWPAVAPRADGGVVVAFIDYFDSEVSVLSPVTAAQPSPLHLDLPAGGNHAPSMLQVGGETLLAVAAEFGGTYLSRSPAWQVVRTPFADHRPVSLAASRDQVLAVGVRDNLTVVASLAALGSAGLDAGDFGTPLTIAPTAPDVYDRGVSAASDGDGFLVAWWTRQAARERFEVALVSPAGQLRVLPALADYEPDEPLDRGETRPRVVFDGVGYRVAYTLYRSTGRIDAVQRRVSSDGGVGPEVELEQDDEDQSIEAFEPGTAGRAIAVLRAWQPDAGAQRLHVRVLAEVPEGGLCFGPAECALGVCTAGRCPVVTLQDGGLNPDAGLLTDGGLPGADAGEVDAGEVEVDAGAVGADAGFADGGTGPLRELAVGCGCGTGNAELSMLAAVLLLSALSRSRRARAR